MVGPWVEINEPHYPLKCCYAPVSLETKYRVTGISCFNEVHLDNATENEIALLF